jgi:hypothetical protein
MTDIVNAAYNEVPCCNCTDYHRDFVLARLVMFWSMSLAGQNPPVPSRDEVFKRCCRSPQADAVTFLIPETTGRIPELQPQPPAKAWWR